MFTETGMVVALAHAMMPFMVLAVWTALQRLDPQIENAALSLGAEPAVTVAPYLRSAVYASLLPRLDMMKSLGLVWIPGVMAGMVVSGASPVYAGIYQFIIVAMILAASGITGLVATVLMRRRVFSAAAQLTLRPAEEPATRP
jgi:putative ABC transport system permease protein